MAMYLTQLTITPDAWTGMIKNLEDRRAALAPVLEAAGGRLHGLWYSLGESDCYVLAEAPDDVAVAGVLASAQASGAFSAVSTTRLLTVEEMLQALQAAGGSAYRAPGSAA